MTDEHRLLREQVGAYALGQLDGAPWQAVHDHLATCAACRAEHDELAPVADLLSVARDRIGPVDPLDPGADGPPLSPELLAQVRAGGSQARSARRSARRSVRRSVRRSARWSVRTVPLAAAAAAVLVAAVAGFGTAALAGAVPQEAVAVRALDPDVRAQAGLVPHTWGMEVKLVATGFDPGMRYRVTVTDDAGRTVGAGEFLGTGMQEMRCNLNSSVLRAVAATVQVTDAGGRVVLDATV
ncbi:MAG: anti-sigma factor family protein [Pseudonocardia sp.]